MKLAEILNKLNEISPFALAESWDNAGLQVGDFEQEITNIVLSLECDSSVIDSAQNGSLIIAHHPLIFKPLKSINIANYPANIVQKAIKKDIAIVAMHTNFDTTHLNMAFAKMLGFDNIAQDGIICKSSFNGIFNELAQKVKTVLGLEYVNCVLPKKDTIKTVAFCCGSGGELIDKIDADVYITGDIKYHQAMLATELGIGIIDATHFASENHFAVLLHQLLQNQGIKAEIKTTQNPFKALF